MTPEGNTPGDAAEGWLANATRIFGAESAHKLKEFWSDIDPSFAQALSEHAYGRMYSREVLSQKQRELCAVAALTALGEQAALAFHVRAAHRQGATREEIAEVICQAHLYAGIPKTMSGLATWRQVFEEMKP